MACESSFINPRKTRLALILRRGLEPGPCNMNPACTPRCQSEPPALVLKESLDLKLWFLGGPSAWPHELFCPFPLAGPIGTMPGTPLHHFGSELGFLVGPNALPRGLLRVQIGRPSSTLARNPFVITLASPMGLQKPFGPTAWRTMLRQTTAPSPRPSHATPQQF